MGNSDFLLERLAEKHGSNSDFLKLHEQNQKAIKAAKVKDRELCIVLMICGLLLGLTGFIKYGFCLAIIIIISLGLYLKYNDSEYEKICKEIFDEETKDAS